jgi:hypothetical protein
MMTRIRESLWLFAMLSTTLGLLGDWWLSVTGGVVTVFLIATIRGETE